METIMSLYSPALAEVICGMLAEGKTLRAICRLLGLPESSVRRWALENPEFLAQSVRARELGCDALADEAVEIADTPVEGVEETITTGEHGSTTTKRADMLGHRRLQIDTRLRIIGKWSQRYGDKVQHDVAPGGALAELIGQMGKSTLPVQPDDD